MNKWIKRNAKKIILVGPCIFLTIVLYDIITTKATQSIGECKDTQDMYDDKEFYELTHNTDGSLNEYGDSLQ
jgi:hypothetical protein